MVAFKKSASCLMASRSSWPADKPREAITTRIPPGTSSARYRDAGLTAFSSVHERPYGPVAHARPDLRPSR